MAACSLETAPFNIVYRDIIRCHSVRIEFNRKFPVGFTYHVDFKDTG